MNKKIKKIQLAKMVILETNKIKIKQQNNKNAQNRAEVMVLLGKALVSKPCCPNSTSEISERVAEPSMLSSDPSPPTHTYAHRHARTYSEYK